MDLLQSVRKEGSRGGVNFSWDDVKASAHRENYLGHSLMAPVGRWAKNRDLGWYARAEDAELTPDERAAREAQRKAEEKRHIKEAEEDAMARALGLPVPDRSNANREPLGESRIRHPDDVGRAPKEAAEKHDGGDGDGRTAAEEEKHDGGDDDDGRTAARRSRAKTHTHHRSREDRRRDGSRSRDRHRHRHAGIDRRRPRSRSPSRSPSRSRRRDGYGERRRERRRHRSTSRSRSRDGRPAARRGWRREDDNYRPRREGDGRRRSRDRDRRRGRSRSPSPDADRRRRRGDGR